IETVSGCAVLIFIYGWPFLQTLAMLLIGTVSFHLRIRRNRERNSRSGKTRCCWVPMLRTEPRPSLTFPSLLPTSCLDLALFCIRSEQSMDMGTSALSKKPWWTLPQNFHAPMVFHMEEDQEELIFGHGDTYLRCIEVHSHTLIQLESWFTATGQTRVTVVGPHRARQWLLHMFCCVGSQDSYHHARGLEMLERVRSQPLTNDDLATSISVPPYTGDLSLAPRISGTVCLSVPQPSPYQVIGCSGFHLSSLYP
uniref:KH domain containing 1 n=2 Tax=Nomascus leucogenys TaxID=61853 RepID=A0A2I3GIG3_NOMLE